MADDNTDGMNEPSDDEIVRMANEMGDHLDRTDGYATDERSREKQEGPVGEPVSSEDDPASTVPDSTEED